MLTRMAQFRLFLPYGLSRLLSVFRFMTIPEVLFTNNLGYAAIGITQVMPTPGLCRVDTSGLTVEVTVISIFTISGFRHAA
jgi:hypothetical protein